MCTTVCAADARHTGDWGHEMAVKVVKRSDSTLQELKIGQLLALPQNKSPNIVQVYDEATHDGKLYIAMELCRGGELFSFLAEKVTLQHLRDQNLAEVVLAGSPGGYTY